MKRIVPLISILFFALSLGLARNAFSQESHAQQNTNLVAAPQAEADTSPAEQEVQGTAEPDANESTSISEENKPLWSRGSLMLDKKTSEWISMAIKSNEKKIPLEILLPGLFPPEGKEVIQEKPIETPQAIQDVIPKLEALKEAPVFYLRSILYFGQNNWTIWLNSNKITNQSSDDDIDKTEDLSIVKASKYEIIFLWKKADIDKIYQKWKTDFVSIDGDKYTSMEKNIVVDVISGNISFILKPNQSLVSNPLMIVEGKASSVKQQAQAPVLPSPGIPSQIVASPSQALPDLSNLSNKNINNSLESLKNLEILKSVLDQNVEKLGRPQ